MIDDFYAVKSPLHLNFDEIAEGTVPKGEPLFRAKSPILDNRIEQARIFLDVSSEGFDLASSPFFEQIFDPTDPRTETLQRTLGYLNRIKVDRLEPLKRNQEMVKTKNRYLPKEILFSKALFEFEKESHRRKIRTQKVVAQKFNDISKNYLDYLSNLEKSYSLISSETVEFDPQLRRRSAAAPGTVIGHLKMPNFERVMGALNRGAGSYRVVKATQSGFMTGLPELQQVRGPFTLGITAYHLEFASNLVSLVKDIFAVTTESIEDGFLRELKPIIELKRESLITQEKWLRGFGDDFNGVTRFLPPEDTHRPIFKSQIRKSDVTLEHFEDLMTSLEKIRSGAMQAIEVQERYFASMMGSTEIAIEVGELFLPTLLNGCYVEEGDPIGVCI